MSRRIAFGVMITIELFRLLPGTALAQSRAIEPTAAKPTIYLLQSQYTTKLFTQNGWGDYQRHYVTPAREILERLPPTYATCLKIVSDRDVEMGTLGSAGKAVLIVPSALSLSSSECRAMDEFVRAGGLLICDGAPGRHDSQSVGFAWRMAASGRPRLGLSCLGVQLDSPRDPERPTAAGPVWHLFWTDTGLRSVLATGPWELPEKFIVNRTPPERVVSIKNGHSSDERGALDDTEIIPLTPLPDARTLAMWHDVDPKIHRDAAGEDGVIQAAIENDFGKGRVIYFAGKVFSGYKLTTDRWGPDCEPSRNTARLIWNAVRQQLELPISQDEKLRWFFVNQMRRRDLMASYDSAGSVRCDEKSGSLVAATTDMANLYDQALGTFSFVLLGDVDQARRLRSGLQKIQSPGGAFPFAVSARDLNIKEPYDSREIVGANSFAVLALTFLAKQTGDKLALEMAVRTADWLCSMQHPEVGALPMEKNRPTRFSMENNLDAYSALLYLAEIIGDSNRGQAQKFSTAASRIRKWIDSMWDEDAGSFARGWDSTTRERDPYQVLDCAAWSILALHRRELTEDRKAKLIAALDHFRSEVSLDVSGLKLSISGFDFNADKDTVWGEGTASAISAYRATGDDKNAQAYLGQLRLLYRSLPHGGVPYSFKPGSEDESEGEGQPRSVTWPSVASTAWFLFAEHGFNPFQPKIVRAIDVKR